MSEINKSLCHEPHPTLEGVLCDKQTHGYGPHSSKKDRQDWAGVPIPVVTKSSKAKIADAINTASPETHTGPPIGLVRNSDPPNSHEAIASYEPYRGTAKERVLGYLAEHMGQWVDAPDLTAPGIGGFAGTRRLRELRDEGYLIETRRKPEESNTWQHRLLVPQNSVTV
jgi:hypothetical protein